MDDFDRTERLISAQAFAGRLGVSEDDVVEWMLAGHIPYVDGPDGGPCVRIKEDHRVDGPISTGVTFYSMSQDPAFKAELARRRREYELAGLDWGNVDVERLAAALADRLRAVAPAQVQVTCDCDIVWLRDPRGAGPGIDISRHASSPDGGSGADRVRAAARSTLAGAQDELVEVTTDPWPRRGGGDLPEPHAEFTADQHEVRLIYGDPADPVLELEPLRVCDYLHE